VLTDLLDAEEAQAGHEALLISADEPDAPFDAKGATIARWRWTEEHTIDGQLPEGAGRTFFLTDGRRNPVDQIEAFKAWLAAQGAELARILCVVHCQLAEKHPQLRAWYDACLHFSDVALLTRRDGVDNKWISDFRARIASEFGPCLVEFIKKGRVHNPALVIEPQARRISHYFDEDADWVFSNADGEEIDPEDEEAVDDEEEFSAAVAEDPYMERRAGGTRRVRELPDIAKFLGA